MSSNYKAVVLLEHHANIIYKDPPQSIKDAVRDEKAKRVEFKQELNKSKQMAAKEALKKELEDVHLGFEPKKEGKKNLIPKKVPPNKNPSKAKAPKKRPPPKPRSKKKAKGVLPIEAPKNTKDMEVETIENADENINSFADC